MKSTTMLRSWCGALAKWTAGLVVISAVFADQIGPPKPVKVRTSDGRFVLETVPMHEKKGPGHCLARLSVDADGVVQVKWERYLINDLGPRRVFVAESGRYVVTMDEWGHAGKFPLVVYGSQGDLIAVHSLESLGISPKAMPHFVKIVRPTISNVPWSDDSITFFGADDETFFVRLHWGRMLILRLRDGIMLEEPPAAGNGYSKVTRVEWDTLQEFGTRKAGALALEMLRSGDGKSKKTGAIAVGQLKLRESIPDLRNLLRDGSYRVDFISGHRVRRVYTLREIAKRGLENMDEPVGDVVLEDEEGGP